LRIQKLHEHRVIVSGMAIAMASLLVRLGITLWVRRVGKLRSGRSQAGVPASRLLADWTPTERQRVAQAAPKTRDRMLRARGTKADGQSGS